MRVCLVYDCLFPHTIGGAERWYRNLADRLVRDGHEVTYLTLRQWDRGARPDLPGVRVVTVGPRMDLYAGPGRRRVLPPIVFGLGVLWHLLRHGRRYDVVHTASFPYFSLLAAACVRPAARYRIVVDWHEVWSRDYWREYLGRVGGEVGWHVQRICAHVRQHAFCFSRLHAARLREAGLHGEPTQLTGEYAGELPDRSDAAGAEVREPLVVFAGRHIPEKRVTVLPEALALSRRQLPGLTATIFGDGPDRSAVLRLVLEHGLSGCVAVPGFVGAREVEDALSRALCLVLPSRREGYGLIVVEAIARGTPVVVTAGPDNAAVELVEEGVNGFLAASADPADLAAAIVAVDAAGVGLRRSTTEWFERNRERLSLEASLRSVSESYAASARGVGSYAASARGVESYAASARS